MRYFIPIFLIITVSVVSIMGFRGSFTENTPLEVFPDMDRQAKFKSQTKNSFSLIILQTDFGSWHCDRGNLISQNNVFSTKPDFYSDVVLTGKSKSGEWIEKIPSKSKLI